MKIPKLYYYLILWIMFISPAAVNAQWQEGVYTDDLGEDPFYPQAVDSGYLWTYSDRHRLVGIDLGSRQTKVFKSWLSVTSMSAVSRYTVYVLARSSRSITKPKVFKTSDGALTWDSLTVSNGVDTGFLNNTMRDVIFFDSLRGFVCGDTADGYPEVWITEDGGLVWNRLPCADIASCFGYHIGPTSNRPKWKRNSSVLFLKTSTPSYDTLILVSDYGKKWSVIPLPKNMNVYDIAFRDSLHGIATRYNGNFSIQNNIAITKDGGKTWDTSYASPDMRTRTIEYVPSKSGGQSFYILTGSRTQNGDLPVGVYISKNEGKTWSLLDENYNIAHLSFINDEYGLA